MEPILRKNVLRSSLLGNWRRPVFKRDWVVYKIDKLLWHHPMFIKISPLSKVNTSLLMGNFILWFLLKLVTMSS